MKTRWKIFAAIAVLGGAALGLLVGLSGHTDTTDKPSLRITLEHDDGDAVLVFTIDNTTPNEIAVDDFCVSGNAVYFTTPAGDLLDETTDEDAEGETGVIVPPGEVRVWREPVSTWEDTVFVQVGTYKIRWEIVDLAVAEVFLHKDKQGKYSLVPPPTAPATP